jgi:ankyrin repeat protein
MRASSAWLILVAVPAVAADNTALFDAMRAGDTAYIKAHLTKPELDARDRRGSTPSMHAAAFGNLNTLKLLIGAGADVRARNDMDSTALLWAAADPEKARLLIQSGADVTVASKLGRTPLMVAAARKGGAAIVELLLSKGADVHAKNRIGETALTFAARAGDLDIVKLLIAKGAKPNMADVLGRGALFAAAIGQNPAIVRLLLQHGAAVNAATSLPREVALRTTNNIKNGPPNSSKVTALHNAAAFGPVESVRELLNAGADVNAQGICLLREIGVSR